MDPEIRRILSILGRPLTNPHDFATRLVESGDDYLRIAGLAALLDLGAVPRAKWDVVIEASKHGAIATRACRFFASTFEYELAQKALSAFAATEEPSSADEMRAFLARDARRLVGIHAKKFLNDLRPEHLMAAAKEAEAVSGWREVLPWVARATVLQPVAPVGGFPLLRLLETANQFEAIEEALAIFAKGGVFPEVRGIFEGAVRLHKRDYAGALQAMSKLKVAELRSGSVTKAKLCQIRAQAYEGLGQFNEALVWYRELNAQGVPQGVDKRGYLAKIEKLARMDVPPLSPDIRRDDFVMLGFPRSGTTMLENALGAHPDIETFEEIPSLTSMIMHVDRALEEGLAGDALRAALEEARERYYAEIDRRKSKPGARVFLDKLPTRSAWIEVMEKFFPEKRYIFSIRHPYDVVLSCFKQSFTQNAAMENFRTLEDACGFYDRVMSIWFGVFPGESERVLYIRYEELVRDFKEQVSRALAFMGVEWSDEVLGFSERSEARIARTPSYGKVRSGLSLGVQSSWQSYRFLFDTPHGAKLHKWVDRFGYER